MFVFLAVITLTSLAHFTVGQICTSGAVVALYRPSSGSSSYLPTDNYLAVCPTQVVGCDGHIAQWQYYSTVNDGSVVYLSIWRSVGPASYTLVGYNVAKANKIGINIFDVPYPEMITVRANDFVGIFYPSPTNLPLIPYLTVSTADSAVAQRMQNCVLSRHFLPTILDNIKNFGMIVGTGIRSGRQPILAAIVAKPDSCGTAPSIDNAYLATLTKVAYDIRDAVTYACSTGYALSGNATVICMGFGQWSSPLPSCVTTNGMANVGSAGMAMINAQKTCDSPPEIENGYVSFNSTRVGSMAAYTCLDDYRLNGSTTAMCTDSGSWTAPPRCVLRGCGSVPAIPNAQLITGYSSDVGAVLVYRCQLGYRLTWGNGTIVCLADGRWSRLPVCQDVDCQTPPQIDNGDFFGTSQTLGSTVIYRCRQGYNLQGPDKITCQKDGSWTKPPSCLLISCGPVPDVPNASPSSGSDRTTIGASVTFACDSGYKMFGNSSISCLDVGFWSPSPTCLPIDCGRPPGVSYGLALYNSTLLGSRASYTCDIGFKMRGNGVAMCSEGGSWTAAPVCDAVDCDVPPAISNAVSRYESTKRGAVAAYVCSAGFEIRGPQAVTCTDAGTWTPGGSCEIVTCAQVPNVQNAVIVQPPPQLLATLQPFHQGATLRFACQPGYSIVTDKNATVTCGVNGMWTDLPVCIEVTCSMTVSAPNAQIMVKSRKVGSQAPVACISGFQLSSGSPPFITCQPDGTWSMLPVCIPVDCGRPPEISNGQVAFLSSNPGSAAEYRCIIGYTLLGDAKVACLPDGNWGKPPICAPVTCSQPDELRHGAVTFTTLTFGSHLTYTCDYGYALTTQAGSPFMDKTLCQADGTWTRNKPTCSEVLCNQLPIVANGQLFKIDGYKIGNTATYRCQDGFTLNGTAVVVCQSSGMWTKPPTCQALSCATPTKVENGVIQFTSLAVGATATFRCDSGYTLRGSSVLVCGQNGEWSGSMPTCQALQCPQPMPPTNGAINVKRYTAGSVAQITCNPGFIISGPPVIICQEDGIWSTGPTCKPRGCPPPPQIANGRVDYGGTDFNARATYSCNTGFIISGPTQASCQQDGSWSSPPSCSQLQCPIPAAIANGRVDYSSLSVGSTVTFYCNQNFVLSGPTFASCMQDGTWSSSPVCTMPMCATPPSVQNAVLTGSTGQTPGSTASYTCVGDYQLNGSPTITCLRNGSWSDFTGTCSIAPKCQQPPSVPFGQVNYASTNVGATATYSCQPNYVLNGQSSSVCQGDGTWSGIVPSCTPSTRCSQPAQITNGQVYYASLTPSSIAVYTCNPGYVLQGQQIVFCQADGTWSYPPPTCTMPTTTTITVNCQQPTEILNGLLTFTGVSVGSQVTYSCNPGYTMQGAGVLVCTSNGMWSSHPPVCARVQDNSTNYNNTCPPPPSLTHGVIFCTGYNPGATAYVGCDSGYELIGRKRYKCGPLGSWVPSAWPPACSGSQDYYLPQSGQFGPGPMPMPMPQYGGGMLPMMGQMGMGGGGGGGSYYQPMQPNGLLDPDLDPANAGNGYPINLQSPPNTVMPGVPDNGGYITPPGFPPGADPYVTGPPPTCGPPPIVPNGQTTFPASQASFVMVSCNVGFVLVGPTVFLTCGSDGNWYPPHPQQPSCIPAMHEERRSAKTGTTPGFSVDTCGDVPYVSGAVPITSWDVTRRRSKAMDTVRYECGQGRQQYGTAIVVCQANGQWSSPSPLCLNCKVGNEVINDGLTNVSAATHIFTDMRVGCNGSVVAWVFYSRASAGNAVYVDVWRALDPRRFQLIGSNEVIVQWNGLNAVLIDETVGRINVQQGDVIGFHYADSPVTSPDRLVIPTATGDRPGPFSPNQLSVTYTSGRSSLAPGDVIDLTQEGFRSYQIPALQALINK